MKRKIISLLCAFAALTAIMVFAVSEASAKTITPNVILNYTNYEYTGSPLGPGLRVYDEDNNLLTVNEDYTIKYNGERIYPGAYTVTVTFIGEYAENEPVTKEFYINGKDANVILNYTSYVYTGSPLGPGMRVYDEDGNLLTYKEDYTVVYNGERIQPGTYSVTVNFIGEYRDYNSVTKEFYIIENKLDVQLNYTSYEFANKPLGPGLTVYDLNGDLLTRDKDYTVKYNGARIEPGTYSVTVNFIGDYKNFGPITKEFSITDNKVDVKLNYTCYEFTGSPLGPGFTVTDSKGNVLTRNVDYDYQYGSGRVEPGTYYVYITLKGDYRGSVQKAFSITENKVNINLNYSSYEFANKPLGPGFTVTDSKGNVLTRNVDYDYQYSSGRVEPGTYYVYVTLKGDYRGSAQKAFSITENKVNINLNYSSYEFANKPLAPGFTVTDSKGNVLTRNVDYAYYYSDGRVEPGTYYVYVTLKGDYRGSAQKSYKITDNKVSIKLNYSSYEYTGSPLGPGFTVTDSEGNVLTRNVDYDYRYSDGRVNPGIYYVYITLKGDYRGSASAKFTIVPPSIKDSSLGIKCGRREIAISWDAAAQTSGYQVTYSTHSNFSSSKTVTVSSGSKESVMITGLDDSTKYYFKVRTYKTVDGTNYYSGWSKSISGTTMRNEIVDVAESQLGYAGGRKYWTWAGYSGRVAWCNIFVTWCADQCGYYDNGAVPLFQQPQDTLEWYQARGLFKKRGTYTPKPGDLIFFNWGYNYAHHIGIVERVENGNIYTIEGNSKDVVKRQGYSLTSYGIIGYATPKYN